MACFMISTAEAIVTTFITKAVKTKEEKNELIENNNDKCKIRFSQKLGWLNKMLWGGSALLALEHIWHGEITPYFPFLTSASNAADTAKMLHEMATVGTAMSLIVTGVWAVIALAATHLERKKLIDSSVVDGGGAL